jgi:phage repressor protein C with HTH and peptisase S24 domain
MKLLQDFDADPFDPAFARGLHNCVPAGPRDAVTDAHHAPMRSRGFKAGDAKKYAQAFGVSAEWLWQGKGQMAQAHTTGKHTDSAPQYAGPRPNTGERVAGTPFTTRNLPVYGTANGAPEGALVLDQTVYELTPCPNHLESVADAYAVYVAGDSMEPRYDAGDLVYVNPNKPVRRGSYVILQVRQDDGAHLGYVKRFVSDREGIVTVAQFNPPGELQFPRARVAHMHVIQGTFTP